MIQHQTKPTPVSFINDVSLWDIGIDSLVKVGDFPSREAVVEKAMQLFFQAYPQQRLEMAIQLYKDDEVTLLRAAELAELNFLDFQEILRARGIEMVVGSETKEEINEGISLILDSK